MSVELYAAAMPAFVVLTVIALTLAMTVGAATAPATMPRTRSQHSKLWSKVARTSTKPKIKTSTSDIASKLAPGAANADGGDVSRQGIAEIGRDQESLCFLHDNAADWRRIRDRPINPHRDGVNKMVDLVTLLDSPITWKNSATDPDIRAFLDDLQANLLKGHGRSHTGHIFMSFAGMADRDVADIVRKLGWKCTSAFDQLRTNRREPPHLDGGPVRCLFLSATGYRALGDAATIPPGDAFLKGMDQRGDILGDPPRGAWNPVGWQGPRPDAMFLLADVDPDAVEADLEAAEGWLNGTGVRILVVERGLQQTRNFRANTPAGVEHFGYVDGRSQPLFLTEDIALEDKTLWDPVFKPSQFIVADPNGKTELSAGSYFVFRKLEQNVRGFNAAEDALGKSLFGPAATQDQLDRAGAMVVGRFEDGTPLVLSDKGTAGAVTNDFTYSVDPDAGKCPFHAHIRKVNPRGDIERVTGSDDLGPGRIRIMARRGITYGPLRPHNADGSEFDDAGHEPEKDVGLLFMAYMASIENQFEFAQRSWANNPAFVGNINPDTPRAPTGIDPIIGQSLNPADSDHTYLDGWTADSQPKRLSFDRFVTMQGGEYFFAPSLSFLRSVGR